MSRLVPLAVALLAIVAGCTGGPIAPGATDTPTETDSPTRTDTPTTTDAPTATATPDAVDRLSGTLAPGVTANGIENTSALLDAHAAELRDRGFELVDERRTDRDGDADGSERRFTVASDVDRLRGNATYTAAGDRAVQRSWLDGSTDRQLVRIDVENETRYRSPPVGPEGSEARLSYARQLVQVRQLADLLRGGAFDVTSVDGTESDRRYTLVGTNFTTDGVYGDREIELTIDGDGVIHELAAEGTLADGDPFAVEYRVERFGVETVEQPDWVASAPEPIDTQPTTGFENCSSPYLTLQNDGPDAVPAESVVTITLNGTEHRTTLDAPLDTDDRRALYLDSAGELRVSDVDSVPTDRTAMPNEVQIQVETDEGLLLVNGAMGFGCESASDGGADGGSGGSGSPPEGSAGE